MLTSKSQRSIAILVDCQADYSSKGRLLSGSNSSKNIRPSTTKSFSMHKNKEKSYEIAQTSKNKKNETQSLFRAKKTIYKPKSRQNSSTINQVQIQSTQEQCQQARKKQLDFLCLQRMVNLLKKYLLSKKQRWNMKHLCYHQMIKILWIFRYISFSSEERFLMEKQNEELKKIYFLWLSISDKLYFTFSNLMAIIATLENLDFTQSKIDFIINEMSKEIDEETDQLLDVQFKIEPQYIFFIKKQSISKNQHGNLILNPKDKERITIYLQSLKINRLNHSSLIECVPEEEDFQLISKKSKQLASNKRKKMQTKIKQNNPEIKSIELHDLLSYKQSHSKKNVHTNKVSLKKIKRKSEIKKQEIQYLSRPKFQNSDKTSDQIQFLKNREQYTFHPKISLNIDRLRSTEKKVPIKNADKVVLRMKEARMMKHEKQNIIERGWTNQGTFYESTSKSKQNIPKRKKINEKNLKLVCEEDNFSEKLDSYSSVGEQNEGESENRSSIDDEVPFHEGKDKQFELEATKESEQVEQKKVSKYEVSKDYLRIPLLYIDVNIEEGKKERIIIYDNDRSEDLAREFSKKHNLSSQTSQKLQVLLQQQMDTVLSRIDEETQQECSYIF